MRERAQTFDGCLFDSCRCLAIAALFIIAAEFGRGGILISSTIGVVVVSVVVVDVVVVVGASVEVD